MKIIAIQTKRDDNQKRNNDIDKLIWCRLNKQLLIDFQKLDASLKEMKNRVSNSMIPFGIAKELTTRLDKLESLLRSSVQELLAQSMRQQVHQVQFKINIKIQFNSIQSKYKQKSWIRLPSI